MKLSNPPSRLGAILSGGKSSRFGSDKAEASFGGRRLVDHAADAIAPWVSATVMCGPQRSNFQNVKDRPSDGLGPLAGLCGALFHAREHGFEAVVAIACDMPLVPTELMEALVGGEARYCESVPVLGCWPSHLASALEQHLASGGHRSMRAWAETIGATGIAWSDLPNINTPADLAAL